jgi:hypothetical protein
MRKKAAFYLKLQARSCRRSWLRLQKTSQSKWLSVWITTGKFGHVSTSRARYDHVKSLQKRPLIVRKKRKFISNIFENSLRNIWSQSKCFVAIFVFPHAVIVYDCRLHATHSCQRRYRPSTGFICPLV